MDKWSSRKLRLTGAVIGLITIIPIIYKLLEIGETVTLSVVAAIGAATGAYNIANAMSKKHEP